MRKSTPVNNVQIGCKGVKITEPYYDDNEPCTIALIGYTLVLLIGLFSIIYFILLGA